MWEGNTTEEYLANVPVDISEGDVLSIDARDQYTRGPDKKQKKIADALRKEFIAHGVAPVSDIGAQLRAKLLRARDEPGDAPTEMPLPRQEFRNFHITDPSVGLGFTPSTTTSFSQPTPPQQPNPQQFYPPPQYFDPTPQIPFPQPEPGYIANPDYSAYPQDQQPQLGGYDLDPQAQDFSLQQQPVDQGYTQDEEPQAQQDPVPELQPSLPPEQQAVYDMLVELKQITHLVQFKELRLGAVIYDTGEGDLIQEAEWRGSKILVKRLQSRPTNDSFAAQLEYLKSLPRVQQKIAHHPNISAFLGVSIDPASPDYHLYILKEVYPNGTLLDFLRTKGHDLEWRELMVLARGAAAGLLHLHSKGIQHQNIAACSLYVDRDKKSVRVDFGLVPPYDAMYWAAPEYLEHHIFNEASDVYSFGILLWEIASLGQEPFRKEIDEGSITEFYSQLVKEKKRPECASEWPFFFKMLTTWCWHNNPNKRPSMQVVWNVLNEYCRILQQEDADEMTSEDVLDRMLWCLHGCTLKVHQKRQFPDATLSLWQSKGMVEQYLIWKSITEGTNPPRSRSKGKKKPKKEPQHGGVKTKKSKKGKDNKDTTKDPPKQASGLDTYQTMDALQTPTPPAGGSDVDYVGPAAAFGGNAAPSTPTPTPTPTLGGKEDEDEDEDEEAAAERAEMRARQQKYKEARLQNN